MLPLLNDPDEEIHFYALLGFGKRKDLAAGPIILETLRQEQLAEQYKVWTMQALGALSGGTWDYDMHQWGPQRPGNQQAIEQFEVWLNKQQKELSWGEPLNGLRCRWVDVPLEVEVGTAPMVSVEIENVRNQPIIWKCQSGITWGFKRSELSTILADFTIQLGQGVRPATTTEITGATLSDSAKDYYRLEAGGKLVLTARLPFTLDKVGETKIGCEVARLDPTTSVDHPLNGFTCPPLLIDVAEPPQHTDAAGAVPSAPGE